MNVWLRIAPPLAAVLFAVGCTGARQESSGPAGGPAAPGEPVVLFQGRGVEGWKQVGAGSFEVQSDGTLVTRGGPGLLYFDRPFRDFVLELEYNAESPGANSGILVRFPQPPTDPASAARAGYEIEIDSSQEPTRMSGAIREVAAPSRMAAKPAGEWNQYRIEVAGQRYQVFLNGEKVNDFFGDRGREGYIGLQNSDPDSRVRFRNIRVTPVQGTGAPESLAEHFRVGDQRAPIRVLMITATHGFRHTEAINAARQLMSELGKTTEFRVDPTEDLNTLTRENLANYDLLFFANSTLRIPEPEAENAGTSYDLTITLPRGTREARITYTGEPGNLTGTITMGTADPVALQDVALDGANLTFALPGNPPARGTLRLLGARAQGTILNGGVENPVVGTRVGGGGPRNFTPVNEAQQAAIVDFARSGKGIVVAHSGLDAFYGWDEYREMVGGGLFDSHPWTRPVRIQVEDRSNPAVSHLGDGFWLRDEIYVLDQNPRWNSHVLLSLDMRSVGIEGHPDVTRDDYPISWVRPYGEGRVFVTKLGHFGDVWRSPAFVQHLLQGMRMAAGRLPADFSGRRVKETIATDVWPDDLAIDERGNVWIVELTGKVHLYDAQTKQTRVVAQVKTTDPTNIEHGLYGVEVDPNFHNGEPYVYLYYAEPESFINTLSRFTYRDGQIDLSTEKVLLRVPTEPACCHQAGDLEWGPNGTLFISTGDTGQSSTKPDMEIPETRITAHQERNNLTGYHWSRITDSERTSQNLQDLRGKILRINKDGSIPKDNPFYGKTGVRWEIYAYGLRNPYRFKYDAPTGRIYIGIVGPDEQTTYDWYDVSERGGENFGWPRATGRLFYNEWAPNMIPGYVPPMWEYTYTSGGRSASFGPIYRSTGPNAFPTVFQDRVFIYDWSRKWIKWAEVVNGTFESDSASDVRGDERQFRIPAKRLTNIKTFDVLEGTSPISMELGPDGCLYLAEFTGFWAPAPGSNVSRYCWIDDDSSGVRQGAVGAGAAAASAPAAGTP